MKNHLVILTFLLLVATGLTAGCHSFDAAGKVVTVDNTSEGK